MPIKKYRVETDKGAYEVEVDEPDTAAAAAPAPTPGMAAGESPLMVPLRTAKSLVTDPAFRKGFVEHLTTEEPAAMGALGAAGLTAAAPIAAAAGVPAAVTGAASAALPLATNMAQRGARYLAGKPQEDVSLGEVASDVLGPATEYGGPVLTTIGEAIPKTSKEAQQAFGMVLGGLLGLHKGNIESAAVGTMTGSWAGPRLAAGGSKALRLLGQGLTEISPSSVAERLGSALEPEAAEVAAPAARAAVTESPEYAALKKQYGQETADNWARKQTATAATMPRSSMPSFGGGVKEPPAGSFEEGMLKAESPSAAPAGEGPPKPEPPSGLRRQSEGPVAEAQVRGRAPQVPVKGRIPPTKAKGSIASGVSKMSATPGFTRADIEAVGGNPDLNYTKVNPARFEELKQKVLAARASRRALHQTTGELNAIEKAQLERGGE